MSEQDSYIIKLGDAEKTVELMSTVIEDMQSADHTRKSYEESVASAWEDSRGAKAIEQLDGLMNGVQYIAHDLYNVATAFAGMADAYRKVHEPDRASIKCIATDPLTNLVEMNIKGPALVVFLSVDPKDLCSVADWISSDMTNKINGWVTNVETAASQITSNGNMAQKAAHICDRAKQIKDDLNELLSKFNDWSGRMKEIAEAIETNEKQLKSALDLGEPDVSAG